MKTWDVIVVGGGVIGISLALELRKRGASVLLIEKSEPGREASWAAAGMIAHCDPSLPIPLQPLADASAKLFPEFVHQLQDESQAHIDFRSDGTIWLGEPGVTPRASAESISNEQRLAALEPLLSFRANSWLLSESSVDPRTLLNALIKTAHHREIDLVSGTTVQALEFAGGNITGVQTNKARYFAANVVNCAGAWAANIEPLGIPTRPVKGHMLSLVFQHQTLSTARSEPPIRHVIRAPGVYVVPRSDGRLVIGSTCEDADFDKRVDPATIQQLHHAAANLIPEIGEGRIHEAWAGLRPGTPDGLPILGATSIRGYFAATGHYRDGIMLAPVTSRLMADLITGEKTGYDLSPFSPERF